MTVKIVKPLKRGERYPFHTVEIGDVWIVASVPQSESVQNAFIAYAKRNGLAAMATRETMPDLSIRLTFSPSIDGTVAARSRSMSMRIKSLEEDVVELVAALNAMGAALASKASSDAERRAVEQARTVITRLTPQQGAKP